MLRRKKYAKRMIALCLAFTLVLSFMTPAFATGDALSIVDADANALVQSVAIIGEQLYLLRDSGSLKSRTADSMEEKLIGHVNFSYGYFAQPEEEQMTPIIITEIYEYEGKLFGFCFGTGWVYQLLNDQGEFDPVLQDVQFNSDAFTFTTEDSIDLFLISTTFAVDGWLYYSGVIYGHNFQRKAGRVNLETGEYKEFATRFIKELVPYQDGTILALINDDSDIHSNIVLPDVPNVDVQIAVFDPESDAVVSSVAIGAEHGIGGYYITGLAYGDGYAYFRDDTRIMGVNLQTSKSEIAAYTSSSMFSGTNFKARYYNGFYIYYGYDNFTMLKLDSESLASGRLTIFGEYGGPAHESFLKNHPEIAIDTTQNESASLELLTQAMVSESNAYDVLMLTYSNMPVDRLIKKGYCLDLSVYPEITSRIDTMYDKFTEPMKMDGKLYGVPVSMIGTTYCVNTRIWEELGLSEDDLPKSTLELLDFIANWSYDYGDEYSDIRLFEYTQMSDLLFSSLFDQYIVYRQYMGEGIRFDTPALRQLLDAYAQINFDELEPAGSENEDNTYFYDHESVFTMFQPVGFFYTGIIGEDNEVLALPLFTEDDPVIASQVTFMIVNPKTARLDEAITYVVNYLDNLDKNAGNISLYPDHNTPVENDFYQSNVETCIAAIEDTKERLEIASAEGRAIVQDELTNFEGQLLMVEKQRYSASAETIAKYREYIEPLMFVQKHNALYGTEKSSTTEIEQLKSRYLSGASTVDQFLRELDQRMKLMELEDQ